MSWNIIEWQGTRDQQRILGITPHFLPVLSSCSSTLFFLYFILELFVTSLPTSALTPSPNSRPQIILGWPKSSFRFFCKMLWKKLKWTFWLTPCLISDYAFRYEWYWCKLVASTEHGRIQECLPENGKGVWKLNWCTMGSFGHTPHGDVFPTWYISSHHFVLFCCCCCCC